MENNSIFNDLPFFVNLNIKVFFVDTDERKVIDWVCVFSGLIESIVNCLLDFVVLDFFEGTDEHTYYASNYWVLEF